MTATLVKLGYHPTAVVNLAATLVHLRGHPAVSVYFWGVPEELRIYFSQAAVSDVYIYTSKLI